jgi:hypothetical protein
MDNSAAANGSGGDQAKITREEFWLRLGQLAEKWRTHHGAGLEIRHQTGKLLNDRFGPPTTRQTRGDEVMKTAARQLQTTESELSRMRWFAHLFGSLADLGGKYREATTWAAVKDLIPRLKPQGQRKVKETSNGASNAPKAERAKSSALNGLKRSLAALSSKLGEVPRDLTDDERKGLVEKFQEFVKVVSDCLKIQLSVSQVPAETALPVAPKE